jgi:acetyl esterase
MQGKLDPHIARIMRILPGQNADWKNMTAGKARSMAPGLHKLHPVIRKIADILIRTIAGARHKIRTFKVESVRTMTIPRPGGKIDIRIYYPADKISLPVIVFFHGGGWVTGDLDQYDNICKMLSSEIKSIIVSVDYRQPPEYKFPAGYEDCLTGLLWTHQNIDQLGGYRNRIAVAGDSAGGNMAAAAAQAVRDMNINLAGQLLLYPILDVSGNFKNKKEIFNRYPSRKENATDYLVTLEAMIWHLEQYMPDEKSRNDPRISPLLTKDLTGLPPAVIYTAELDPLRDDGAAYAHALESASVPVSYHCARGMIHGFFDWIKYSAVADKTARNFCEDARQLLHGK